MKSIGIIGLGHYLPKERLTNFDLAKIVETTDEWIVTRTGIKERRIAAKGEKTSQLAIHAAREALKNAGIEAAKIDLIIVATISPDSNFPSTACLVQKALGAKHATAFDIGAACSGFLYGVTMAKQSIQTGLFKNALIVAAEKITSLVDWKDRSTCVLFGDGAGACVLAASKHGEIISDYLESDGSKAELMQVISSNARHPKEKHHEPAAHPFISMQGKELFKVAVHSMAHGLEIACKRAGIKLSDIDCVVPHQANDRIITAVAEKLKLPKEKIFINIHKYGNMSAASIAVALYEAVHEGRIKRGDYVALVAFGAGLVSGANIVKW